VKSAWDARATGLQREAQWNALLSKYTATYPQEAAEFTRRMRGDLPADFVEKTQAMIARIAGENLTVASRKASQIILDDIGPRTPGMLGGSADLTGSNLTNWKGVTALRVNEKGELTPGDHINYGVREFGMAAVMNGIALHGGFIPFGGTFLTFSDYSRNAIRMAALMKIRVIHVFTHDSIGLGEDGPTHQPVEHCASLRLIPNLHVWRPADAVETAVAWKAAILRRDGPTALLLSRQNLAPQICQPRMAEQAKKGGYVLFPQAHPDIVLMASGSEVSLAMQAAKQLVAEGILAQVVSMPSTTVFDQQSIQYKASVLPYDVPRVAVEAGVTDGWWKYQPAAVLGLDRYGESAPAGTLFKFFGITADSLAATAKAVLDQ
jgi:transketolase